MTPIIDTVELAEINESIDREYARRDDAAWDRIEAEQPPVEDYGD